MAMEISPRPAENHIGQHNLKPDSVQQNYCSWQDSSLQEDKQDADDISVSEAQVIRAIEQANNAFQLVNTKFEFSIHEKTKKIMVRVYNEETDELIREIPPEKILDIVAKMWELAGILVDERV